MQLISPPGGVAATIPLNAEGPGSKDMNRKNETVQRLTNAAELLQMLEHIFSSSSEQTVLQQTSVPHSFPWSGVKLTLGLAREQLEAARGELSSAQPGENLRQPAPSGAPILQQSGAQFRGEQYPAERRPYPPERQTQPADGPARNARLREQVLPVSPALASRIQRVPSSAQSPSSSSPERTAISSGESRGPLRENGSQHVPAQTQNQPVQNQPVQNQQARIQQPAGQNSIRENGQRAAVQPRTQSQNNQLHDRVVPQGKHGQIREIDSQQFDAQADAAAGISRPENAAPAGRPGANPPRKSLVANQKSV